MSHGLEGFVTNLTGGLSRLWCQNCQEERIHKGLKCVCGAIHKAYPVRSIYSRGISVAPRNRRGVLNGGYPIVPAGIRAMKVPLK